MIYLMKCNVCDKEMDIGCPIELFDDIIAPGISCKDAIEQDGCKGKLKQVIVPSRVFARSPFPHSGNEIALPTNHFEDIRFTDKVHAREYLGERGLMSKWIENDM